MLGLLKQTFVLEPFITCDTIADVKAKIEAAEGIPFQCQRIEFAGKVRQDDETLSQCGVGDNSTLVLVFGLAHGTTPAEMGAQSTVIIKAKMEVRVLAYCQDRQEQTAIDFLMSLDTVFDKMFKAWCGVNELPPNAAIFEDDEGRLLLPEDTPGTCGWSLGRGTLTIRAYPRDGM